jgi:hypothetical protein
MVRSLTAVGLLSGARAHGGGRGLGGVGFWRIWELNHSTVVLVFFEAVANRLGG